MRGEITCNEKFLTEYGHKEFLSEIDIHNELKVFCDVLNDF